MQAIIIIDENAKQLFDPECIAQQKKPVLAYLLMYLKKQGIKKVILSLGVTQMLIQDYFQKKYANIKIDYVVNLKHKGTGGAILQALRFIDGKMPIFILTGNKFVKLNFFAMYQYHLQSKSNLTLVLTPCNDCANDRTMVIEQEALVGFQQSQGTHSVSGLINVGLYLMNPAMLQEFVLPDYFSFENDFLYSHLIMLKPKVWITNGYIFYS